jgi:hypothetical protein
MADRKGFNPALSRPLSGWRLKKNGTANILTSSGDIDSSSRGQASLRGL